MKPRTNQVYGKKRVMIRLEHMIDPLVLAGIDEVARRRSVTRAQCVRDALFTIVHETLRGSLQLLEAPDVPFAQIYEDQPRLRLIGRRIKIVDEFGLPTDEPISGST
jgi:hypothetical protein